MNTLNPLDWVQKNTNKNLLFGLHNNLLSDMCIPSNIKKDKLVFHGTEQLDITYTNISKIELRRDGVEIKTLKGDNESIYFRTNICL